MEERKIIKFPEMKVVKNDFEVEFELSTIEDSPEYVEMRENDTINDLHEVNEALLFNDKRIEEWNKDIAQLTNSADGIDYMIAVGSGILAGIIDSFWVGEFILDVVTSGVMKRSSILSRRWPENVAIKEITLKEPLGILKMDLVWQATKLKMS